MSGAAPTQAPPAGAPALPADTAAPRAGAPALPADTAAPRAGAPPLPAGAAVLRAGVSAPPADAALSSPPDVPSAELGRFASPEEFREVIERTLSLMRDDPLMGPKLRAAETPQRFSFPDLGQVLNVRSGTPGEGNLVWRWSDDVDWQPRVTLTMTSEVANRYFQGRENVAIAIARRRIQTEGEALAAIALLPLIRPLFPLYRAMLSTDYPHLEV